MTSVCLATAAASMAADSSSGSNPLGSIEELKGEFSRTTYPLTQSSSLSASSHL